MLLVMVVVVPPSVSLIQHGLHFLWALLTSLTVASSDCTAAVEVLACQFWRVVSPVARVVMVTGRLGKLMASARHRRAVVNLV